MKIRPIELSDLAHEVRLSDIQISPGGDSVIVVTARPDYEENRFRKELVLIDVASGRQQTLDAGPTGVSQPRFSPGGDLLAYLADDENDHAQLVVSSRPGIEVRRLTNAPRGVKTFAWRPDGAAIAFAAEDAAPERQGEERHNKSFEVGDDSFLAKEPSTPSHVWIAPIDGKAAERLTAGREGFSKFFGSLSWSPDGRSIAFAIQPRPDSGAVVETHVVILDVERGTTRRVGPSGSVAVSFSPDGRHFACCSPRAELGFGPAGIFVDSVATGSLRDLSGDIDRDFLAFGQGKPGMLWMPDSRSLLLTANDKTRRTVWIHALDGAHRRLDLQSIEPGEICVGRSGGIAFIGSTSRHPNEVYFLESLDAHPRRITNFNAHIAGLELGERTSFSWDGPDSFENTAVITYPPRFQITRKYPLVLEIHGGPMSTSTEAFNLFHHLLAAEGWIVFSPNYRGSNNMGSAYQRAVINDAGDGPTRDIMSGLTAITKLGSVDQHRLAVSGWSYGGFLTTWLTAHHHVWRSAVAGAAVSSWMDWYNLADLNVWCALGLGGSPWRNGGIEHYLSQSSISYAHRIRTPTLLMSNTGDRRVSVTQSHKLYHALKDNGTHVSFIAYPMDGHFPDDPIHERDIYRRWIGWIREHFEPSDPPRTRS